MSRIASFVLGLVLIAQPVSAEETMWGMIGRSLKQSGECARNPAHDYCKPTTASELLMRCGSGDEREIAYCHGALDAYFLDGKAKLPEWKCLPKGAGEHPEQLRQLFLRVGYQHPEVLHEPARQLLFYAVAKAFPCRFQPDRPERNRN